LFNAAIHALRMRVERTFAWEDKFKRLLLRFERIQQRHYGMKLLAYTLINLRAFCGVSNFPGTRHGISPLKGPSHSIRQAYTTGECPCSPPSACSVRGGRDFHVSTVTALLPAVRAHRAIRCSHPVHAYRPVCAPRRLKVWFLLLRSAKTDNVVPSPTLMLSLPYTLWLVRPRAMGRSMGTPVLERAR